ncbi:MAG: CPBP family intramembrane glutamic endopeptidase [Bryobacteraceae bacterium]
MPSPDAPLSTTGLALRVALFAFLEIAGVWLFGNLFNGLGGYVIAAFLGTFAAAAVANGIAMRVWERGQLADIGLGWTPVSVRHLVIGLFGGVGAALLAIVPPLITRQVWFQRDTTVAAGFGPFIFVTVVLLFAAIGEEMLFRGYGFQLLMGHLGPFATILPFAIVFGFAHAAGSVNFSAMALLNTTLWGVILGFAFLRSGDLWLPIALHFGWNWALSLLGAKVSGYTMGVTGYSLHWGAATLFSGGDYGPEASLFTLPILVLLFFYLRRAPIVRHPAFLLRQLDLEDI